MDSILNIVTKSDSKPLQELVQRLNAGNITVKEYSKTLRDLRANSIAGSKALMELKSVSEQYGNATATANGKMMRSYFSTGEELRRFYREQRVGDRTMREATQAVGGFSSMLGGEGLGKIVGTVTSRFQEMEFTMTGMGIAAQSTGGKFAGLSKTLMGLATPLAIAAAAIGVMYAVGEKVAAVYERLNTALDKLGKQSFGSASKETQIGMLDKQIRALMKEQNESPSFWAALGGAGAMTAEQTAQNIERQTKLNELIEQRKKLEESLEDEKADAERKQFDMEQARIELLAKKEKERQEASIKATKERIDAERELAKFMFGTNDPFAPIEYQGSVKPISQAEAFAMKKGGGVQNVDYVPNITGEANIGEPTVSTFEALALATSRWNEEFNMTNQLVNSFDYAIGGVASEWTNVVSGLISGTMNIGQAFKQMGQAVIQELQMIIAKMIAMKILSSILGLITGGASTAAEGFVGSKARGGYVAPGQMYTVGEEGIEGLIMSPGGGGYVIPNENMSQVNKMSQASGSGGVNVTMKQIETRIEGEELVIVHQLATQSRTGRVG